MNLAFTICQATYLNGAPIGIVGTIIKVLHKTTPRDSLKVALTASIVAAAGTVATTIAVFLAGRRCLVWTASRRSGQAALAYGSLFSLNISYSA